MRSPELRQRFSNSRTTSPAVSRSNSFNSLSALEEGHVALSIDEEDHDDQIHYSYTEQDLEAPPDLEPFETMASSLKFVAPIQRPCRNFVPDIEYKDYLYGQAYRRKQGGMLECCDGPTCARGCASFSAVAVLFLLFIGILIDKQPMFIQGVRPKQYSDSTSQNGMESAALYYDHSQRLPAASNAYATAGAYFLTMLISFGLLHSPSFLCDFVKSQIRRRNYRDIPDASSDADSVIPVFHVADQDGRRSSPLGEVWNRFSRKAARFWKPTPKTKRR